MRAQRLLPYHHPDTRRRPPPTVPHHPAMPPAATRPRRRPPLPARPCPAVPCCLSAPTLAARPCPTVPLPSPDVGPYRAAAQPDAGRHSPSGPDAGHRPAPPCRHPALPCHRPALPCHSLASPSPTARLPLRTPGGNEPVTLEHYARPPLLTAHRPPHRRPYSRRLPFTWRCYWPPSTYIKVHEICTIFSLFNMDCGLWWSVGILVISG
jgi:hypothetical protein